MNYYPHHLGDYDGHTSHLTWDEDMAYTRLLRAYYRRESAIPDGEKHRLARAVTAKQRAAVDSVLAEFFLLDNGAWRNKRADREIAIFQSKSAKAKEAAHISWECRRNANAYPQNAMRTHSEGNADAMLTNSQEPIANSQEPKKERVETPDGASPPPDLLITFPLREGGEFPVTSALVAEVEPLCPAVDVPATLREMKLWLVGNPDRRKTRKGIKRFITNWLKSEQEKHGG